MKINKNIKIILIFTIFILLIIISRYPFTGHEVGLDSFSNHVMIDSLTSNGYAKWVLNPLSYFQLYPLSRSSGVPFLTASLESIINISTENTIFLCSIFFAFLGSLGLFMLFHKFENSKSILFLCVTLFIISPIYIYYSFWTLSYRILFFVLIPYFYYSLFMIKDWRFIPILFLLGFGLLTAHRLALVAVPLSVIVFPIYHILKRYFGSTSLSQFFSYHHNISSAIILLLLLILFLIQFSQIPLFPKEFQTQFSEGTLFESNSVIPRTLNLGINYFGNVGLFLFLFPFSIFQINDSKKLSSPWLFFLILIMIYLPTTLVNDYASILLFIPLFIFTLEGIKYAMIKFDKKILKAIFISILLIVSGVFSIYMSQRKITNTYQTQLEWLQWEPSDQLIETSTYVKFTFSDGFISNDALSLLRLSAYSGVPFPDITLNLLIFDYVNASQISVGTNQNPIGIFNRDIFVFNDQNRIATEISKLVNIQDNSTYLLRLKYDIKYYISSQFLNGKTYEAEHIRDFPEDLKIKSSRFNLYSNNEYSMYFL